MSRPPRVFISGPIRVGRVADNLRRAMEWGTKVRAMGASVYCPHANYFWEVTAPQGMFSEEDWMEHDLEWLDVCDAVFLLDGYSAGAERETKRAKARRIPVFTEGNPGALEGFISCWLETDADHRA